MYDAMHLLSIVLLMNVINTFQVRCCRAKILIYVPAYNSGLVELQGSNGEKANCFFTATVS